MPTSDETMNINIQIINLKGFLKPLFHEVCSSNKHMNSQMAKEKANYQCHHLYYLSWGPKL